MATRADPLTQTWERHRTIAGALSIVDHKALGLRYMITALLFFCLAGIEALFMRTQLVRAENNFLSPDVYNQLFTLHGTTMVFFFAAPVLFGFGNFLIPLMIGGREMAFPRLNAFGYWVFLFSGLFMSSSILFGLAPNGAWHAYPPLSGPQFSPGLNLDFWSLGLIFLSISILAGAVNFIVTIFIMRAPGMYIKRMPLFAWAILVASFVVLLAVPALTSANLLLVMERKFGLHFFQSTAGGSPLLWQHLFWVFGQPEFYIILLPAVGIVLEVVGTFSRRPILGYSLVTIAIIAIGALSCGVYLEYLFAAGISPAAANFSSMAGGFIAIPIGILIFTFLGTLLTGRPVWKVPLMWVGGFIFLVVVGALTGLMLAAPAFNRQVTNTYFVVANLHSMLVGGAVFPMFAGFTYWFPKISGRMLNERLGKVHFWLFFIGFLITFFPMFTLGIEGMPRHVYTYGPGLGWDGLNLVATIGAFIIAESMVIFIINLILSLSKGEIAGDNPWDGSSLEWAAASPPEPYNFRRIPDVRTRVPLRTAQAQPERVGTTVLDALPESIVQLPGDSLIPFLLAAALSVFFLGLLLSQYWLAGAGAVLTIAMIFIWLWPSRPDGENL